MPARRSSRKRQTKLNFSPAAPSPKATKKRARTPSDDEDELSIPRSAKRQRFAKDASSKVPESRKGRDLVVDSDSSSSSEEEKVKASRKKPKSKSKQRKSKKQPTPSDDDESEEDIKTPLRKHSKRKATPEDSEDEDEDEAPRSHRRQPKQPAAIPINQESEEEVITPRRKNSVRHQTSKDRDETADEEEDGQKDDNSEEDDLKEDLAFLRSSPLPEKGRLRSTQDKPKNARQRALDALKAKRAGNSEPPSSATPNRKRPVVIDSDSEGQSELEVIEEEEEEEEEDGALRSDGEDDDDDDDGEENQTTAMDIFRGDAHDESFIDDDEALLGAPANDTAIPIEFTAMGRAKPRDLFKFAVEWMVKKKINPAFASTDEIYGLAFRKLDDEVSGLANSKFSSSVWAADFTRALRARPELHIQELGPAEKALSSNHCEACNRKAHTASFIATFREKPYNRETLEPLVDDSDPDSDGDSSDSSSVDLSEASEDELNGEKATYDATGERIPPESKQFFLGSTCKANAHMAHTLHHWRYHLNSWVVDDLVRKGYCTPEQLAKRDKQSTRKREKKANKIVDKMEKEGEIKKLYRLYKDQLDYALEASNEYRDGWGKRR